MSLLNEQRYPLSAKSKLGIGKCRDTLVDWHKIGRCCRSGSNRRKRVFLEALYEGRSLVTSREAVVRFLCALNGIPLEQANTIQG